MHFLTNQEAEALKLRFSNLLDNQGHDEEVIQQFMQDHTQLIPRHFVQNHEIHLFSAIRKLPFGADYKSDFCFLAKSSADYNCVLIEIEKASKKYFNKDGSFTNDFDKAIEQVEGWRAWLQLKGNADSFDSNTLMLFRRNVMSWNPVYFKFVLVYGRRAEFETDDKRTARIRAKERDDFQILTYDSLVEQLSTKYPLYLTAVRNGGIDVLNDMFLGEYSLFEYTEATQMRIKDCLRADLERAARAGEGWQPPRDLQKFLDRLKIMNRIP